MVAVPLRAPSSLSRAHPTMSTLLPPSVGALAPCSVVVPVYRSEASLEQLHVRVFDVAEAAGLDVELVLVDDASPDRSWDVIRSLAERDPRVVGVRLGRNAGQQCATLAGLRHATRDVLVTMDDDLQCPPEAIPDLVRALSGEVDLVYGVPRRTSAVGIRSMMGREAKRIVGTIIGLRQGGDITSFRAVRRHLVDLVPDAVDRVLLIDTFFGWYTDNLVVVPVEVAPRPRQSRYRYLDLFRILLDGSISFGAGRLRTLLVTGATLTGLGGLITVGRLVRGSTAPARHGGRARPATGAIEGVLLTAAGLQMVGVAILAEHAQRVQLRTAGQLPYWIRETTGD